jgi:alpha-L-fucosidase
MYVRGRPEFEHHVKTYGPQDRFGYKDFIPMFRAERFDADAWADLFCRAGARFVVPVAEHHDGFAMYDSSFSRWNAMQMGPRRDIVGELAAATRKQGMIFGLSTHREEHWWFMNGGREFPSDVQDSAYEDFYGPAMPSSTQDWGMHDWAPRPDADYLDDWLARTVELVEKYQPQLVWFDGWINQIVFKPYLQKFAAYYYNRGVAWDKGVAINYKNTAYEEGTAVLDIERGQLKDIRPMLWQNDTSISKNSWGYVADQDYKTAGDIIGDLVDVVSKNGCLLLNIGPKADGTIPQPEQAILLEIGRWLAVNEEAIYGSQSWRVFGEGPTEVPEGYFTDTRRLTFTAKDFRFTRNGNTLYAVCFGWPDNEATIASEIGGRITQVSMLGAAGTLDWRQDAAGLHIRPPAAKPCDHAYTYKIELAD